MNRIVEPEILDRLRPEDPRARRSRGDLRRLNRIMLHPRFFRRTIESLIQMKSVHSMVELGSGDGWLLARLLSSARLKNLVVTAVDREPSFSPSTIDQIESRDVKLNVVKADVMDWLERERKATQLMIANLFLHHFETERLRRMLEWIAERTEIFAACEPRRSGLALSASRCLGLIGCDAVTRHDAPVSVRAGFRGTELSALWPDAGQWRFREESVGPFSHGFVACRR